MNLISAAIAWTIRMAISIRNLAILYTTTKAGWTAIFIVALVIVIPMTFYAAIVGLVASILLIYVFCLFPMRRDVRLFLIDASGALMMLSLALTAVFYFLQPVSESTQLFFLIASGKCVLLMILGVLAHHPERIRPETEQNQSAST